MAWKLAGATYEEVHERGGGINHTVTHTRESSEAELLDLVLGQRSPQIIPSLPLFRMLCSPTSGVETCFAIDLSTDGCWGENTCRIQNTEV